MDFDPYYQWLGIHPSERPADLYRLLGINRFESNADVISHAADRVMLHVRTFQHGKHAADSQRILNELASASRTLLNPQAKASYDQDLQRTIKALAVPVARVIPVARAVEPPPATPTENAEEQSIRIRRIRRRRRESPFVRLLLIVAGPLLGLAVLYYVVIYGFQGPTKPGRGTPPSPTKAMPEPVSSSKPIEPPQAAPRE